MKQVSYYKAVYNYFKLITKGVTTLKNSTSDTPRYDTVSEHIKNIWDISFYLVSKESRVHPHTKMILSNHTSMADFPIDKLLASGDAIFISRRIVKALYPIHNHNKICDAAYYFHRGSKNAIQQLNDFYPTLHSDKRKRCLVYPEGTRNPYAKKLKLKTGCMKGAYSNNLPVQIMITQGKAAFLSFKTKSHSKKGDCRVAYSSVVYPDKFTSCDDFIEKVQSVWDFHWKQLFEKKKQGAPFWPSKPTIPERPLCL